MSDYVDGELDLDSRKRVERHVRFCHRCHTVLGNLRQTVGRLRALQEKEPARGDDPDAVVARVAPGPARAGLSTARRVSNALSNEAFERIITRCYGRTGRDRELRAQKKFSDTQRHGT